MESQYNVWTDTRVWHKQLLTYCECIENVIGCCIFSTEFVQDERHLSSVFSKHGQDWLLRPRHQIVALPRVTDVHGRNERAQPPSHRQIYTIPAATQILAWQTTLVMEFMILSKHLVSLYKGRTHLRWRIGTNLLTVNQTDETGSDRNNTSPEALHLLRQQLVSILCMCTHTHTCTDALLC